MPEETMEQRFNDLFENELEQALVEYASSEGYVNSHNYPKAVKKQFLDFIRSEKSRAKKEECERITSVFKEEFKRIDRLKLYPRELQLTEDELLDLITPKDE